MSAGIRKMNLSLGAGGASDLSVLCEDGERVLCRGWRVDGDGERIAVLAVLSAAELATPGFVDRLAHEYALKDELDGGSAARPLARVREHGRTMLASPPAYQPRFATYTNVASYIRTSSRPMCGAISMLWVSPSTKC